MKVVTIYLSTILSKLCNNFYRNNFYAEINMKFNYIFLGGDSMAEKNEKTREGRDGWERPTRPQRPATPEPTKPSPKPNPPKNQ